jgi:ATP-dependent Zn protease
MLGAVYPQPREERYTRNKEALLADIKVSLGGYVAEKMHTGTSSSGVSDDFKKAMQVSSAMVWRFGMSDAGFVGDFSALIAPQGEQAVSFLSEALKEKLNNETNKIINTCLKEVEDLLKKEWNVVERFAKELLEKDELEYDEIESIFKEYGKSHYTKPA